MENTLQYKAEVINSSRELTGREKLKFTDTTGLIKLVDLINKSEGQEVELNVADWAVVQIQNDLAKEDKEYTQYVLITDDGNGIYTGSESFWQSYMGIYETMKGEDEEYTIKAYKVPSKNREGQSFVTCSIV